MKQLIAGAFALVLASTSTPALAGDDALKMTIYKTPRCGCCGIWADAVKNAGYEVEVHDMEDVSEIVIDGDVVEGKKEPIRVVEGDAKKGKKDEAA